MSKSRVSSTFRVLSRGSRSPWLLLENIVIALALTYIDGFKYDFTQLLGMTISRANSTFSALGSRSRSLWLFFFKKNCHRSLSMDFNITSHKCGYDNISSKFDFQGPGLKVKVTVAIFIKTLSSL